MKIESTDSSLSRRRILASLAGGIGIAAVDASGISTAQAAVMPTNQTDSLQVSQGNVSAADLTVHFNQRLGAMNIDRFSLGQGGFSSKPLFPERTAEIRALRPRVIRLFLQEYYDLLPALGKYHFATLDQSVDLILETGAKPLLCMVFKPKVLFPRIDQDLVVPTSWSAWDALVYNLVRHYKERNGGGWYWEVGNEWNRPDGGGTPYHMTPEQYTDFYQHTVVAIRRADPHACVGGPAQGDGDSAAALIPALLSFCDQSKVPLDFVSWHHYPNDPRWFRQSIESMRKDLRQYPSLHPETVIDEWNMGVNADPRIQPAYVAEATFQMTEAGLDLSCYYQIRDYPFAEDEFPRFYPASGVADQKRFWDRRPISYGLFDYENRVRPAYFVFMLLERLTGERIGVQSSSPTVHGLATIDLHLKISSILLWNYSDKPVAVDLRLIDIPADVSAWRFLLDVGGNDHNDNLRSQPVQKLSKGNGHLLIQLDSWGVTLVSLEEH